MYYQGQGFDRNLHAALSWFEQAAAHGHANAMQNAIAIRAQIAVLQDEQRLYDATGVNKVAGLANPVLARQCVHRLKQLSQIAEVRQNLNLHRAGLGISISHVEETQECITLAKQVSSATPLTVDIVLLCAANNVWDALDAKLAESVAATGTRALSAASAASASQNWRDEPYAMRLDCGRLVQLVSLQYERTYAGLLEGKPGPSANARILKWVREAKSHPWGERKTHFIPPVVDESDPRHPALPKIVMRAWLTCLDPIDPAYCASELVVVWLTDDCHQEPMADVVFRAVRGLPWDKLADDFDY